MRDAKVAARTLLFKRGTLLIAHVSNMQRTTDSLVFRKARKCMNIFMGIEHDVDDICNRISGRLTLAESR